MKNSDLFDDSESKKEHIPKTSKPKRKLKNWQVAIILISLSILVGVVVIPIIDNISENELVPVPIDMSQEEVLLEEKPNTESKLKEEIEVPSEEKPEDIEKHDFVGSNERISLTRDNKPIFWYVVATEGQWQGDFSDGKEKPTMIKKEGYMEFQFKCYEKDGKMKYFGNFRNLEGKAINVAVLKGKDIIDEKRVDINKAVILEGNC